MPSFLWALCVSSECFDFTSCCQKMMMMQKCVESIANCGNRVTTFEGCRCFTLALVTILMNIGHNDFKICSQAGAGGGDISPSQREKATYDFSAAAKCFNPRSDIRQQQQQWEG